MTHAILEKETYEKVLTDNLLSAGIIREFGGKLISSRKLIENARFFETEDAICKEWLNSVYDSYYFYDGFDSLDECAAHIFNSHYENSTYRIVKFLNMYYAVVYENTQHQQVIGKDVSYYTKNKLFLTSPRPPHSLVVKQRVRLPVLTAIYHELYSFDPSLKVYRLEEGNPNQFVEVKDSHEETHYIVLLGITFKDVWYPCNTPHHIAHSRATLNVYFNAGYDFMLFGKYVNAIAINPFQRLICLAKGRVEHFQMDSDDPKTPLRRLPYREEKHFHEMIRIRPVKENDMLKDLL